MSTLVDHMRPGEIGQVRRLMEETYLEKKYFMERIEGGRVLHGGIFDEESKHCKVFVARDDAGQVVGTISTVSSKNFGQTRYLTPLEMKDRRRFEMFRECDISFTVVWRFSVAPEVRKSGVGTSLRYASVRQSLDDGSQLIFIEVNEKDVEHYLAWGFEVVTPFCQPGYVDVPGVLMRMPLDVGNPTLLLERTLRDENRKSVPEKSSFPPHCGVRVSQYLGVRC